MNWRMISTLVYKDMALFLRNRLFAPTTILMLIVYAALYFAMPRSVDEVFKVGLYSPVISPFFIELMEGEGLIVQEMESERALKMAMIEGEYNVGVVLEGDLTHELRAEKNGRVKVYYGTDFPGELQDAYIMLLQELAYRIAGQPLNIDASEEILGPDMTGKQLPFRNRMIPLFAFFILMIETMVLASLITEERERRTLQALLVTPLRIEGLMLSKCITGIGLAFIQLTLILAVIGGLRHQTVLILVAILLGSFLVTGIGFLLASVGKDVLSVSAWGLLAIMILGIPSFGVMVPGVISDWVKFIPSFYLIDTIHQVVNFKAGWGEVWINLLILLACGAAFLWTGTLVLRRNLR